MKNIKYGLKLWSHNEKYLVPAEELFRKGIYDYIELYIVPGTYENFISKWRGLDIPFVIHCTHSEHGFNLAESDKVQNNLKMFSEVKAFCDQLNAQFIIFHPGVEGTIESTINQVKRINDERLLVENKPYISMVGQLCQGSLYEELAIIIESCKIGFCLDVAHAINTAFHLKVDCYKYLEKLVSLSPRVIHISDEKMGVRHDNHLSIGEGDFDFKTIAKIISSSNASHLTLETSKKSEQLSCFVKNLEAVKKASS